MYDMILIDTQENCFQRHVFTWIKDLEFYKVNNLKTLNFNQMQAYMNLMWLIPYQF